MPGAETAAPPLPPGSGRLLSDMGMRRGRTTGAQRMHAGMDLGHPGGTGTPVLNVQSGVVDRVLHDEERRLRAFNGYGNGVIVYHEPDDTWALYAHMDVVDVQPGQRVGAGHRLGTMGNTSNGKFRGMGPHLHLELRRRSRSGQPPFPGPYPRSPQQPFNNLDPRPWLQGKGLAFLRRGGFEIAAGSPMARSRPMWESLGGVDPYPTDRFMGWKLPETSLAGLGQGDMDIENEYEPPARFDRDVYLGLSPVEWAAAGAGALVLTGTAVALVVRGSVRPNRFRRRRRRLKRRRTSRRLRA